MIFIRIIVSWILFFIGRRRWTFNAEGNEQTQGLFNTLSSMDSFLGKICDPYLKLFQGVSSLRRSNLDLTPLLALVILNLVRSFLSAFADMSTFSGGYLLAILVSVVWKNLFSFLLFLLIVVLIIRLILGRSNSPEASSWINNTIDPILNSPVSFVYKLFFRNQKVDDQKLVVASLIFYLVVQVGLGIAVNALVRFLMNL